MDKLISQLDFKTDFAVKVMLQNVVNRKRKYDKYYKKHLYVMWATMICAAVYILFVYFTVTLPYSYSFYKMFSAFVNNSFHIFAIIFLFGLYGYMNVLGEKRDKAEKEFHALRCEIVAKSRDLWHMDEAWPERHEVFEMMLKNYDINLYHENK